MSKSEHEVQNEVLDYLNRQADIFAWRSQSTGIPQEDGSWRKKVGFDLKGVSDIVGVYSPTGRLIAIEVKKPGSTVSAVSKYQKAFLSKVHRMGGASCWLTTVEAAENFVNTIRGGTYVGLGTE